MAGVAAFVVAGGRSSRMGRDKAFLVLEGQTLLQRALALARSVSRDVKIVGQREKYAEYGNVIEDAYPGQGPLAGIHAALTSSAAELNLVVGVDTPFLDSRFVEYLVEQAAVSGATVTVPVMGAERPHPISPNPGEIRVGQPPETSRQSSVVSRQGSETSRQSSVVSRQGSENSRQSSVVSRQPGTGNQKLETRSPDSRYQPLCAVYRREFGAVAENALRQGRNNIVPLFAEVSRREIGEEEMRQLAFDPRMFDNLNTPEEWDQACRRMKSQSNR